MNASPNDVRKEALAMLRSRNFFDLLRGVLRELGLAGEEKIGVGIFVSLVSRFLSNPIRLCLQTSTDGSVEYVVHRGCKLFPPGSVINLSPNLDEEWQRFTDAPDRKVVFIPEWSECPGKTVRVRFEVRENRLARIRSVPKDGRTVETRKEIDGHFVSISPAPLAEWNELGRWLTIKLPTPRAAGQCSPNPSLDFSVWHQVQRLLRERAERRILLPTWDDLVVEKMCEDKYAQHHIPAFLQAWKTMCLLRSFLSDGSGLATDCIHGDFESYAATGNLLKKVFREGSSFPSPKYVYNRISKAGTRTGVISPVTGKGLNYEHVPEETIQFEPLIKI